MKNYFCNLKAYDERGKRVAVFGVPIVAIGEFDTPESIKSAPVVGIKIFELSCSKKDQFVKKEAKEVFEKYLNDRGEDSWKIGKEEKDEQGVVTQRTYHPKIHTIVPEDTKRPKWSFLKWVKQNFRKEIIVEVEFTESIEVMKVKTYYHNKVKTLQIKALTKCQSQDQ